MEKNYQGDLRILHYLEILKQEIGFSQLKEKVKKTAVRAQGGGLLWMHAAPTL